MFATETGFYPDPYYNRQVGGFGVKDIVSTGISVFVGIFMVTFAISFLSNFISSDFMKNVFKGRSLNTDAVAQVADMIATAYEKFKEQED